MPPDGVRARHYSPPGQPQPRYQPKKRRRDAKLEEQRLRAWGDEVSAYLDFALKAPGIQRHRFTRELFALSRKLTRDVPIKTAQRALRYRIVDLVTLRRIAWLCISQQDDVLPEAEVAEDFQQRPAYQEGCLTDPPDLSVYDQLLEESSEEDENHEQEKDPLEVHMIRGTVRSTTRSHPVRVEFQCHLSSTKFWRTIDHRKWNRQSSGRPQSLSQLNHSRT